MIRFVDSCSWCSTSVPFGIGNGPALKYNTTSFFSGARTILAAGPEGQNMYNFFDCTVLMEKQLTTQNHWRESRTLFIFTNNIAEANLWSWGTPTGIVATWTLSTDGRIRIRANGDGFTTLGTLLYTSQTTLALHTFYFIDLDWYFPTTGPGTCSLYINGVLDTGVAGFPSVNGYGWSGVPDRFTMVGVNNSIAGYSVCDIVVSDGQGAVNNTRLGPSRVKLYNFNFNGLVQWPSIVPSTAVAVNTINDTPTAPPAPDGDASYITGGGLDADAVFGITSVDCYAGVLGVALSVCLRDPNNGSLDLVVRQQPSTGIDTSIASVANPNTYAVVQGIIEQFGGSTIVDGAIGNAWWGVKLIAGTPLVTQIVLEKVTTRSGAPYQCGQLGSYCF